MKTFSMDGRIIFTVQGSGNLVGISAESLPDGIYFVKLLNSDHNVMTFEKISIQNKVSFRDCLI
jgi:hypothetical protein